MSDFFRSFNKIVGQRQRATMAYRPQANGTTERMVGTLIRAVKMISISEIGITLQSLTFALNTAQDRVRGDTPFYLLHGCDPRSTLEAMVPLGSTRRRDREPRRWRYRIQKQYQQAREQVNERLRDAIQERADRHNETVLPHKIEVGTQVWLYLDRGKEGYARKLAHMWRGPFRVLELVEEHAVRLEIAGTEYRLFPVVHVSKIKPLRQFPYRPKTRLTIRDQDRFDFDEALLPEDSWVRDLNADEYEVEKIVDMRSGRRTRYGRTLREFWVNWKGYDEPTWVDEVDRNCGALLYDYLRDRTNPNRFEGMQSHEEP
ncbi:reverse transcriptase [Phytophthora palmivora]|uniref:Reverse transcriptase n=1 Tax=Phytophthora palmivora TaxID=4796 RepID=A0A2P4X8L1_9STRA|nr:reverse transcriptase [Phytophthora palmivora]